MKVAFSKQLVYYLIAPCWLLAGLGLYGYVYSGQKLMAENLAFILLFGIPSIVFAWLLIDKRVQFKTSQKLRNGKYLLKLPFSSGVKLPVFFSGLCCFVVGLSIMSDKEDTTGGFPMLLIGLIAILLVVIANEHPRIWFADTFYMDELLEKFKDRPIGSAPYYDDGIFTYQDNSFTCKTANEAKTINWNDVLLIKAYKVDMFTTDRIIIEIYAKETIVSINDETLGHMKFMETAAKRLDNFKEDWFEAVAFPAFETNLTIIYKKADEEN